MSFLIRPYHSSLGIEKKISPQFLSTKPAYPFRRFTPLQTSPSLKFINPQQRYFCQPKDPSAANSTVKKTGDMGLFLLLGGLLLTSFFLYDDKAKATKSNDSAQSFEPLNPLDNPEAAGRVSRASFIRFHEDKIAEVFPSQVGFTIASDKKPVLATCGSFGMALGGYDAKNKIAFLVHFSSVKEVQLYGEFIVNGIVKLAKNEIESPIQLHLRRGVGNQAEEVLEAVKIWLNNMDDLPMEIVSQEVDAKWTGLSIDARTGEVFEYFPQADSQARGMRDCDALMVLSNKNEHVYLVNLAYAPKNETITNAVPSREESEAGALLKLFFSSI